MSTRRNQVTDRMRLTPLMAIAAKSRLPQEEADTIALLVLICLDAVKRGAASNALANTLTEHMATAQALWAGMRNRPLWEQACASWKLWCKACNREPERPIALTTGEYNAVRTTVSFYLRSLPQVEVGQLVHAKQTADRFLKSIT
jgi:hypothetical protein